MLRYFVLLFQFDRADAAWTSDGKRVAGFALPRGNVANHEIDVVLYRSGSSLGYFGIAVRLPNA